MKTLFLLLAFTAGCFAQATVNLPALTVSAEAVTALNTWLVTQLSGTSTTLTAPVGIGDTTINVASTAGIAANSGLVIDNEAMQITAKTATTFTVTRGIYGTAAATHTNTTQVNELKYPPTGPTLLNGAFRRFIADTVASIMQQVGSPTINAQKTAITNANNTINTTANAGVQ